MKTLIKRNVLLYFRDKTNIFFSMLAVLIIIVLFALFLRLGNWGSTEIRDTWLMAGVLSVAAITTSMGAFEIVISDRINKTAKGFYASPVSRGKITAAYIISPFIAGTIMTAVTAIGFGIYIVATGGEMPGAVGLIQLAGLILLSNITGTAILCLIVSLIKSMSAWNTIGTIIGTLSGFLMGVYAPMGILPNAVQTAMVLFPPFHSAMLFRQILMERPIQAAYLATHGELDTAHIKEIWGVTYSFGDFGVTPIMSVCYLVAAGVLFFGISVVNMRRLER